MDQMINQIEVVDGRIKSCIMDLRSMRGSSGILDNFIVKTSQIQTIYKMEG